MFQLEISGIDNKELQRLNKPDIDFTFLVFHLEISGKDNKDLHSSNKLSNN